MLKDFMSSGYMQGAVPPVFAGLASSALSVEIGNRFTLAKALMHIV